MSLNVKPQTGKRSFVVARHTTTPITNEKGGVTFLIEKVKKCPSWGEHDCERCSIARVSFRIRKTGSIARLEILACSTHDCQFSVYPYGDVPYGRQALVPINAFGEARFPVPAHSDEMKGGDEPVDLEQQVKENLEYRCPDFHSEVPRDEVNYFSDIPRNTLRDFNGEHEVLLQHYQEFSEHSYLPSLFLGIISQSFGIKWSKVYMISHSLQFWIGGSQKTQLRHAKGFLNLLGIGREPIEKVSEKIASIVQQRVTAFQIMALANEIKARAKAKRILEILRAFRPNFSAYFLLLALGTEAGFWGRPLSAN